MRDGLFSKAVASSRRLRGRLRTYAYGIVATLLLVAFAFAERATEQYVSDRSRATGTAIELSIFVLAALAFRPFHRRVELFIEGVFTKRRREAREALARLKQELTSFNDPRQVLRRVAEAVDQHMGTAGSAIYLLRHDYTAEASTFDVPVERVAPDDALVVRLRSAAAPANPRALKSSAAGEVAFPMMASGELIGFLTLTPKRVEYDAEDRYALSVLAEATGLALVALDPQLRAQTARKPASRPNNLPRQSTSFVGRSEEVNAVADLVRQSALVTIVGAGGMGKTRLALQVAGNLVDERSDGAWLIDLAPIGSGSLVASAILSTLDVDQTADGTPVDLLVAFLAPRALLLLLDNCEHVAADVARIAGAILSRCPNVTVLATSREPLGITGENVHRLPALDDTAAAQLFAERAQTVNERFELNEATRPIVADICRRLDGMALAIELAAARVRSISVEELSRRLQLRLLAGGRDPLARHQTMHALIDWSYDLLSVKEQRLFSQLAVFAGGATLDAVTSTCLRGEIDEWELLDVITALVDKSLLVADVSESSQRYRFLESIRAYARERLESSGESEAVLQRHAQAFAVLSDRAYEEFDTLPPPGWLARYEAELDNVRAAMTWALDNDREAAARIAGGFGVIFLRLTLVREGIDWCERALTGNDRLAPAVKARAAYVLSMLYNNQACYAQALKAAEEAADAYRLTGDDRGSVRARSQIVQQLAKNGRSAEAIVLGDETIAAARRLNDRGVLAAVLARCANLFEPQEIEQARLRFAESVEMFRELGRDEERARVLEWWALSEYYAGNFDLAAASIEEALSLAQGDVRTYTASHAALIHWVRGDRDRASTVTREALALAARSGHSTFLRGSVFYAALIALSSDPAEAARLVGYAGVNEDQLGFDARERVLWDRLNADLRERLGDTHVAVLRAEGAAWNDDYAVARASKV